MINTQIHTNEEAHCGHHVRFYEGDNFIYEAVAEFFSEGLRCYEPLVLISTPDHRDGILNSLATLGLDAPQAIAAGQFRWLDARETLSKFMVAGMPDSDSFRTCIGQVLEERRVGREHLAIRAFGEMVDLLLRDGNPEGALRLEELWNEIGQLYGFSLLCAYSIGNLYRQEHWRYFRKICDQHSQLSQETIDDVVQARDSGLSSIHISSSRVRDFALRKVVLAPHELIHFSDCDLCSELWWRLKRAAKAQVGNTLSQNR